MHFLSWYWVSHVLVDCLYVSQDVVVDAITAWLHLAGYKRIILLWPVLTYGCQLCNYVSTKNCEWTSSLYLSISYQIEEVHVAPLGGLLCGNQIMNIPIQIGDKIMGLHWIDWLIDCRVYPCSYATLLNLSRRNDYYNNMPMFSLLPDGGGSSTEERRPCSD